MLCVLCFFSFGRLKVPAVCFRGRLHRLHRASTKASIKEAPVPLNARHQKCASKSCMKDKNHEQKDQKQLWTKEPKTLTQRRDKHKRPKTRTSDPSNSLNLRKRTVFTWGPKRDMNVTMEKNFQNSGPHPYSFITILYLKRLFFFGVGKGGTEEGIWLNLTISSQGSATSWREHWSLSATKAAPCQALVTSKVFFSGMHGQW